MKYTKKHTSENRDIYILNVSYDFRDEWHYSSKDMEMPGYFEEEVKEAIEKIRAICAVTRQGEEACQKAFNGENSVVITLKNGLSFSFDLMSVDGQNYPIIDIDEHPVLTYFDQNGDEFNVEGW